MDTSDASFENSDVNDADDAGSTENAVSTVNTAEEGIGAGYLGDDSEND